MNRRWRGMALGWGDELRSLVGFSPLILGAVVIALLATTAGPASTYCLFQSPVSPISPLPIESPAVPSPVTPQETVAASPTSTPSVLTAVPTPLDFIPWFVGLLVIVAVVGAVLYWRSRRKGEEESA